MRESLDLKFYSFQRCTYIPGHSPFHISIDWNDPHCDFFLLLLLLLLFISFIAILMWRLTSGLVRLKGQFFVFFNIKYPMFDFACQILYNAEWQHKSLNWRKKGHKKMILSLSFSNTYNIDGDGYRSTNNRHNRIINMMVDRNGWEWR